MPAARSPVAAEPRCPAPGGERSRRGAGAAPLEDGRRPEQGRGRVGEREEAGSEENRRGRPRRRSDPVKGVLDLQ